MKANLSTRRTVLLALVLVSGFAAMGTYSATASEWGISLGFARHRPVPAGRHEPSRAVVVDPIRRWVPEHFETRSEQVLVSPTHHVQQYINPVYENRLDHCGRVYTVCVQPGYWTRVCVPARYETRCVKVLVPGYYEVVPLKDNCDSHSNAYGQSGWTRSQGPDTNTAHVPVARGIRGVDSWWDAGAPKETERLLFSRR